MSSGLSSPRCGSVSPLTFSFKASIFWYNLKAYTFTRSPLFQDQLRTSFPSRPSYKLAMRVLPFLALTHTPNGHLSFSMVSSRQSCSLDLATCRPSWRVIMHSTRSRSRPYFRDWPSFIFFATSVTPPSFVELAIACIYLHPILVVAASL